MVCDGGEAPAFELLEGDDSFAVIACACAERRRVVFRLEGETVTVSRVDHDEEVELFTVEITKPHPNTGRSRLRHRSDATTPEHPLPWQVLRRALEPLFFPGEPESC